MLVRGASAKFWAQVAALSLFSARSDAGTCSVLESQGVSGDLSFASRDADAWSVFEIPGVSGDPLVVFAAS